MSHGKRKLSKAEDEPSSESEVDFIASRVSRSRSRGRSVTRKCVRSRSRSKAGNKLVRGRLRKLNAGENARSPSQIISEDDAKCSRSVSKARSCISAFDRSDSIDRSKRRRGRPPKHRDISVDTIVVSEDEKVPIRRRSVSNSVQRSRSSCRPKRNARRPKKLLTDSSSEASQASNSDEEETLTGSKKKTRLKKRSHPSNVSINSSGDEQRGTKCGFRSTRSSSFNLKENIESEQCKDITSFGEPKKRKLSPEPLPKITGDKDVFCWQCHRHGNNMLTCHVCPRVYHRRCAKIDSDPETWICLECNSTMEAGSFHNLSEARSLSQDELNQLFKFIIERILCQDGAKHFRYPVDLIVYPKYSDYIIHPMDLTLIEKNINNNKYKTTESFVADMKWLVHNSYIFNTPYSELTTYAKRILKIVKQETEEIDTCPHCYYHYHTMEEDTWFVEPCKKPHLIVWAKLRGFPHWPAKVMRVVNDLVDVRFFGDHNRSWLNPESCYLFSKSPPFPNKIGYQKDYGDCLKEVFIHIKQLQDRFQEFHFSPPRLKFVPAEHEEMLLTMLPFLNLSVPDCQRKDDDLGKFTPLISNVSSLKNINIPSGNSPKRNLLTSKTNTAVETSPIRNINNSVAVLRKYEPLNKTDKLFSKENVNTILHVSINEELVKDSTKNRKSQSSDDCTTSNIKQEINDEDFPNANCNLNQDSINLCKSKTPQVVLTRIHINGELSKNFPKDPVITKESQITSPTSYLAEAATISEKDEGSSVCTDSNSKTLMDVEVIEKENVGGVSPTNSINHDGGSENNSGHSSRIMLKVKSSAELLSSEALIKHNEKSTAVSGTRVGETDIPSCKKVVGSKEPIIKPLEASSKQYPQPDVLNICQSYSQSLTKMNDTIEKVIRGEITVVLPSRELKSKSTTEPGSSNNKPAPPAQSKIVNVTAAELESETDENSESEVIENGSVFSEGEDYQVANVNLEQELVLSQNLTDVSAWSIEPFVENAAIIDSMKETFNNIEQSQNLEECKKFSAHLKKLAYLQRKEMKNLSKKIKDEAKEVFEIFMNEKEKLFLQKKEMAKTVKTIKLTQWCNFCLKEANFYCCWGTSYCSKDCQHKDWDIHFEYCKQSENDSDKLRVANPGYLSKFRLPPSVTINKLSNSTSSSNQVTITKTACGNQVSLAKTISQGILQPSVTTIKKNPTMVTPAVIKPSESTINKSISLTSKSLYLAGSSSSNSKLFKVATGVLERTPMNLLGKKNVYPRSEPQKIIIRTDQLKSIGESISVPGMYKIPVSTFPKSSPTNPNLILSNSQVKVINSNNVPYIVQRPATSQNTPNQKAKFVVFKQQNKTITL